LIRGKGLFSSPFGFGVGAHRLTLMLQVWVLHLAGLVIARVVVKKSVKVKVVEMVCVTAIDCCTFTVFASIVIEALFAEFFIPSVLSQFESSRGVLGGSKAEACRGIR